MFDKIIARTLDGLAFLIILAVTVAAAILWDL